MATFFYPAAAFSYKNHAVILDALAQLRDEPRIRAVFTLSGTENQQARMLREDAEARNLPIDWVGGLTQREVFEQYTRSVLLFPSTIETAGLPLLEARLHRAPVIAADLEYAREALEGHDEASFFATQDAEGLAGLMRASAHRRGTH